MTKIVAAIVVVLGTLVSAQDQILALAAGHPKATLYVTAGLGFVAWLLKSPLLKVVAAGDEEKPA